MRLLFILLPALMICSMAFSQNVRSEKGDLVKLDTLDGDYVRGEIIVKFKEGYLNRDFQSS
jgi:hypothetical protein